MNVDSESEEFDNPIVEENNLNVIYEELLDIKDEMEDNEHVTNFDVKNEDIIHHLVNFNCKSKNDKYFRKEINYQALQNMLSTLPLVYTTRLEQMKIFKKENLTMMDMLTNVIIESKPIFIEHLSSKKLKLSRANAMERLRLYYIMKNKLQILAMNGKCNVTKIINSTLTQISTKENTDISKTIIQNKNKKLLSLCKPFSIVLYDFKKSLELQAADKKIKITNRWRNIATTYELTKESKKVTNQADVSKYDKIGFIKSNTQSSLTSFKIDLQKIPNSSFGHSLDINKSNEITPFQNMLLILYETNKTFWDIYNLDESGNISSYYKTYTNNETIMVKNLHEHKAVVVKDICCWYKREEFVKNSELLNIYATRRFLRSVHDCKHRGCHCCCKIKSNTKNSRKTKPFPNITEIGPDIIADTSVNKDKTDPLLILNPQKSSSKIIDRALRFKYYDIKCNPTSANNIISCDKLLKNKLIHIKNTATNEIEMYEVGENGQIDVHLQCQPGAEMVLKMLDGMKKKIFATSCCWVKRELIISKLICQKLAHTAISYIRRPHTCAREQCRCCCSFIPVVKSKKKLQDISLTKHVVDFKDKTKLCNSTVYTKSFKHVGIQNLQDKININSLNIPLNQSTNSQQFMDLTSISQNPQKIIDKPDIPAGVDVSSVHNCISAILETFNGVQLVINDEGKVAASINTPVNSLTTGELRILANIISCAQEQVNALGKFPTAIAQQISLSKNPLTINSSDLQSIEHSRLNQTKSKSIDVPHDSINTEYTNTIKSNNYQTALDFFRAQTLLKRKMLQKSILSFSSKKSENISKPIINNIFSLPSTSKEQNSLSLAENDNQPSFALLHRKPNGTMNVGINKVIDNSTAVENNPITSSYNDMGVGEKRKLRSKKEKNNKRQKHGTDIAVRPQMSILPGENDNRSGENNLVNETVSNFLHINQNSQLLLSNTLTEGIAKPENNFIVCDYPLDSESILNIAPTTYETRDINDQIVMNVLNVEEECILGV